jgi:hypothetical protein
MNKHTKTDGIDYLRGDPNLYDKTATGRMIRLQAAAPDMLEALKWADKFYQDNLAVMPVAWQGVADAIETAIAKAERGQK